MPAVSKLSELLETYPFIPGIWILLCIFAFGFFSSWSRLAKHYKYKHTFVGQKWNFQSLNIGNTNYSNCVAVGSNYQGLYLSPFILFRFGHPPILIPWEQLNVRSEKGWFVQETYLQTTACPNIEIRVSDRLLKRISQASQGKFSPPAPEISELPESPDPVNIQFSARLFLKVFAWTFALGLALGLCNHGLAQYQAWQYPERYSLYSLEEYTSPRYGDEGPNIDLELLGFSRPIRVRVEQKHGVLVSEYYYSVFGSIHQNHHLYGISGGGIFSTPLYTINALLPLVIGWIGSGIYSKKLKGLSRSRTNSQAAAEARATLAILFHSGIMGFASLFSLYLIPNVIVTAFIDLLKYQG